MKHNKLFRRLSIAIASVLLITTSVVSVTLAKYTSKITGTETGDIAKWGFTVDGADAKTETWEAAIGRDAVAVTTAVAEGKIAPGTQGSFKFTVTNDSDVSTTYTVNMSVDAKPTNLKFYYDSEFKTEYEIGTSDTKYDFKNNTAADGKLAIGDKTGETITVYWKWAFETENGDEDDTKDGKADKDMVVTIKVVGDQDNPNETTVSE